MKVSYSPTYIANNILSRSFADKIYISPMKLQKILYFVASEYAKRTGRPLLETKFETWAYGPVVYGVYDEFRQYNRDSIRRYAKDPSGRALIIDEVGDPALRDSLDSVWNATRYRGAVELSEITHREDSAWDRAFQEGLDVLDENDIAEDDTYNDLFSGMAV